jgi:quercetin dioxygenase-like cupin family protein
MHHPVGTMHRMPNAAAVADAVARNTRRLRTERGWSLDQLASRSGVSKGMLVHVEGARTNPSLGTMCKPAETARLWSGLEGSFGDLLVGSDERDHTELWRWTLAAGDRHASEAHVEGTREALHVVDGTLTLEVDGVAHTVPAGGAALFHADRPHAYRNDRRRPVRFVMVVLQPDADLDEWAALLESGAEPSRMHG